MIRIQKTNDVSVRTLSTLDVRYIFCVQSFDSNLLNSPSRYMDTMIKKVLIFNLTLSPSFGHHHKSITRQRSKLCLMFPVLCLDLLAGVGPAVQRRPAGVAVLKIFQIEY